VHLFLTMILVRLGLLLGVTAVIVVAVLFATGAFGGEDTGGEAVGAGADEAKGAERV